ncbi:putative NBD/HSP70 family sugar kinase [Hydrogenispora ethanolica]|uniref:Putative NBD/HSP70 family sugar kinase n=1 Tax=Hydrogenispora ethanolica TaxID=1082276 RepID=A0A4R1R1P4_HYDET|nr:ROK family transcriptional regulator [Hydrogenispora ethanolica]TCL59254.1 putative NBD/HSP70 family sugar kinase [Hydrogenispora ethanolica]
MKWTKTASHSRDLKVLNRMLALNTIRLHGPIARYEVAKMTGLAAPTVTVIVNDLIGMGIVQETGHGASSGGRRPVMLELDPAAGYIFAVRIQQGELVAAGMDLAGGILESRRQKLETTVPGEVVAAIGTAFEQLVADLHIRTSKVRWCGIAAPGLVNSREGIVERSSNLGWSKVRLGELVSERLGGTPVHVENISNAAALGEKSFGSGKDCSNLIFLNLSVGVGAGIIIHNDLFGGSRGYAGEVGTAGMPDAPEGECSRTVPSCYRTLEEQCGVRGILEQARAAVPESVLAAHGLSSNSLSLEALLQPPLAAVPAVRRIMEEASRLVGMKVAELMNVFDPEMVILGGELARCGGLLLDEMLRMVEAHALPEIREAVQIVISTMPEDPPLMGVYALVLDQLFYSEEWIAGER